MLGVLLGSRLQNTGNAGEGSCQQTLAFQWTFIAAHENTMTRKEKFKVNFARTQTYLNSTIPQTQRLLNSYFKAKNAK